MLVDFIFFFVAQTVQKTNPEPRPIVSPIIKCQYIIGVLFSFLLKSPYNYVKMSHIFTIFYISILLFKIRYNCAVFFSLADR